MTDRSENSPVMRSLIAAYERGDEVLVDPMDFILLDSLPPEGTMFAGAYPDGPSSQDLAANLFEGKIPAAQVAPRLRVLSVLGFCLHANRRGVTDRVWQITEKGEQLLADWKRKQEAKP